MSRYERLLLSLEVAAGPAGRVRNSSVGKWSGPVALPSGNALMTEKFHSYLKE